MIDYKSKALKYKLKYLSLKNKNVLVGGTFDSAKISELRGKGFTDFEIEYLQQIERQTYIELTDDQMYELCSKPKLTQPHLGNITLKTISNGGNGNGIFGDYYNQCFYISLVHILKFTGIAPNITVEELRKIGKLRPNPDNQMWDNDNLADRNAIDIICNYFFIEVRFINSTSDNPRKVKHGSVLLDGCPVPLGSWVKADVKQGTREQPLVVYIAHMSLHFEAVQEIILSNGEIYYTLGKEKGKTKNISDIQIKSFLAEHPHPPIIEKHSPKLIENTKSKKCNKNSKESSVDDSSGGIKLTEFIIQYYNNIVNGKLNEHQKELEKLIDIYNNINNKIHYFEQNDFEKDLEDLLKPNKETDILLIQTQIESLKLQIDEYNKNKKLKDYILKQINEFK